MAAVTAAVTITPKTTFIVTITVAVIVAVTCVSSLTQSQSVKLCYLPGLSTPHVFKY